MNDQQTNSIPEDLTGPGEDFQSRLLIVVATYNEAENISRLLDEIFSYLENVSVLVIDDNSPDGTGEIVQKMSDSNPKIHILHREGKLGLGSATVEGFQWGLECPFDWILTMDADFSHHPESLPTIFSSATACSDQAGDEKENVDSGPDIVIGSRYVSGGKIEGWPLRRRIASRLINGLTRLTIGLKSNDNSGAYRCYSRSILEKIDLGMITNKGYGYLQQILFLANKQGAVVKEVPITFRDRTAGQSKINFSEAVGAIGSLLALARKRWFGN